MHATSGLRVLLKWKINRPDSVITDVIQLGGYMKYGLRSVLVLTFIFAIAFAIVQRHRDREARITLAVVRMRDAVENDRNPLRTSTALRSLQHLGLADAEIAIRRFQASEQIGNSDFFCKLPFLFSPTGSCPTAEKSLFYCNGLVFDTLPNGLGRGRRCDLSEFDFNLLKLEARDFIPPDDLLQACEITIDHFCDVDNLDEREKMEVKAAVYSQAHYAIEHLYPTRPNSTDVGDLLAFLSKNKLKWNANSGKYEIR